ncbi:MAG: SRPBCC family protein [Lachnospiraceae bacterium]|nr:SRPBCC family protein [Lachnospiraceae bacterium]
MATSNKKATIKAKLQDVWDVVTSLENYQWRSEIKEIEVISERQFAEITKDGYKTTFTVTRTEPCKCWEFDMENENIQGHWTGLFCEKGDVTEIDFTEVVTAKKLIMKPFVKGYLKKQQERYISDLRIAVER